MIGFLYKYSRYRARILACSVSRSSPLSLNVGNACTFSLICKKYLTRYRCDKLFERGGVRPQGGGLTKGGEWGGYCFDLLLYWSHAGGASASAPISASAFADSWFCFYLLLLLLPTTGLSTCQPNTERPRTGCAGVGWKLGRPNIFLLVTNNIAGCFKDHPIF